MTIANLKVIPEHLEKRIKEYKTDSTRLALLDKIKQLIIVQPMSIKIPVNISEFIKNGTEITFKEPINPLIGELKKLLKDYEDAHYSDILEEYE